MQAYGIYRRGLMASLFVKDSEVNEPAIKAEALQGKTKTQAVKDALREVVERLEPARPKRPSMTEWVLEYRRRHPLPPPTGLKADKAFCDSLNDEDDD
jgi:antitoxin VapB